MHDKVMACRTLMRITAQTKFLARAAAFLSATFSPNNYDFFDLCLHWVSVFRVQRPSAGTALHTLQAAYCKQQAAG